MSLKARLSDPRGHPEQNIYLLGTSLSTFRSKELEYMPLTVPQPWQSVIPGHSHMYTASPHNSENCLARLSGPAQFELLMQKLDSPKAQIHAGHAASLHRISQGRNLQSQAANCGTIKRGEMRLWLKRKQGAFSPSRESLRAQSLV